MGTFADVSDWNGIEGSNLGSSGRQGNRRQSGWHTQPKRRLAVKRVESGDGIKRLGSTGARPSPLFLSSTWRINGMKRN